VQAFKVLDESVFVGVYDPDAARAQAFAQQYGFKWYTDLAAMLNNPAIQMVSICTPHPTHPDLTVACAEAGRHILVEKPMAVDLQGCDRMIAAAERANVRLGVISQRRLYESVQRVKQAIEAGKIGRPILAMLLVLGWRDQAYYQMDPWRGKWATEGGGIMLTQTTHQIDLLQWFMGPIQELFGYWGNLNHPYIEVEDNVVAVVKFKGGALGSILLSNSEKPGFYAKIHVHGETGASVGVQTDGGSPFISGVTKEVDPPINDIWTVPGEEHLLAQWQAEDAARMKAADPMTHYHKLQIQDFLCAILENREPTVNGQEGRKLVEIVTAVYRSQRDQHPVSFPVDAVRGSEDFDGRLSPSARA
jgi:predicted dehydrogenase